MMKWRHFLPLFLLALPLSSQSDDPTKDLLQREKERQMQAQTDGCKNSLSNGVQGPVVSGLRSLISSCQFHAVNEQDILLSQIRGMGIDTPLYFANAEQARQEELRKRQLPKGDQLIITRNIMRFDQSDDPSPAITAAADTLGEEALHLSGDVKDILLQLQDSYSTHEFLRDPRNTEREGMDEVFKLAWMWDQIGRGGAGCGERVDSNSQEVKDLMWSKPGRVAAPAQIFFGLKSEEDLSKMNSFKWQQGPHIRYLFNSVGKGFEQNWVLAEYDKTTGEVRFTHFKMVRAEAQAQDKGTSTPGGASAAIPLNMSLISGADQLGVKGWVGASVQTGSTGLPWGKSLELPTGVINLAQIQLNQSTENIRSSQTITATTKNVTLNNTVVPNDTTSWDLQTRASVQTESGNWSAGAGVRVYNVMLGYDTSNGKDHSFNMTVVDGNNYVKYDNNSRSAGRVSMGHMWDNKKGGVAYSYDAEKSSHRIEIVVLF